MDALTQEDAQDAQMPEPLSPVLEEEEQAPAPGASGLVGSSDTEQDARDTLATRESDSAQEDDSSLRAYMLTHSLKGRKTMKYRPSFIGQIETIKSPIDAEIEFGIKRVGNRERLISQDRNATIRYISRGTTEDGSADSGMEYVTEKDYPQGSMRLDTIALCLSSWNLCDEHNAPLAITNDTILDRLDPDELDFLYDESIRINPILLDMPARKKASSASSSPS